MHKANIIDTYMTYHKRPRCIVGRFERKCLYWYVAYGFQSFWPSFRLNYLPMRFLDCLVCCKLRKWYILYASDNNILEERFFAYFQLCRRSVSSWVCRVMHHHYGMLHHVNCSCLPQFSFFLNLSVTCWLTVGRLSVTCQSTDGRQLADRFFGGLFFTITSHSAPLQLGVSGTYLGKFNAERLGYWGD